MLPLVTPSARQLHTQRLIQKQVRIRLMRDQEQNTTAVPYSAGAYKPHRHIKVLILGKGETETPVVRWIRMYHPIVAGGY
jgi:hypothetical protein